ncbi:MAG: DUF11 domain-containing protein [Anaerolineae bacterium]|nr:DUF11 domain-containing protein [Anaerolineae bacterium]
MKGNRTMKDNSTSDRDRGPTWMLALLLALLAVVALGLTTQAGSGPFDGSAVVPTAEQVRVGQQVGFALYVVNTGSMTATDVLMWSPLPPGSTYVSASGGAFPVMGGQLDDELFTAPPEGQAYDVRLRTSIPLTETNDVTGIAWVGDVPPGEMVTLGLIVAVDNPAGRFLVEEMFLYDDRELVGQFSGETWVPLHTGYLPLVASQAEPPIPTPTPTPTPVPTATVTTVTFTIPYGEGLGFGGGSLDPDYGRALVGASLNFGDGSLYLGQTPPMGPYQPWYAIARAYGGWDTSRVPDDAEVLSATLVLDVACNPPTTTFGTTIYRGVWTPPLDANDWYAMGNQPVGAWNTAEYPCSGHVGSDQVWIDLDPSVVNQTGLTLLEMRSDREGTPPVTPEQVQVSRSPSFPALIVRYVEEP